MIRILSYNIHGCVGRGGKDSTASILSILKEVNADVVALQEVYNDPSQKEPFLKTLKTLEYPETEYAITDTSRPRGAFGNVLMSRIKAKEVTKIDLSVRPYEPRNAIRIQTDVDGCPLDVTATHLGLNRWERLLQLQKLSEEFDFGSKGQRPDGICCLVGDLNEWSSRSRAWRLLDILFGKSPRPRTFPSRYPALALDRILVMPQTALQLSWVINSRMARLASDHLPLVADLTLRSH